MISEVTEICPNKLKDLGILYDNKFTYVIYVQEQTAYS